MASLSEQCEEILEMLWIYKKEKNIKNVGFNVLGSDKNEDCVKQLVELNFIEIDDNGASLTDEGDSKGENVVRRHRLAEKLLVDVIDLSGKEIHDTACKLEHYLKEGIEDKVCTLLGHPKTCPHGNKIPEGQCCKAQIKIGDKYVLPLTQLKVNQIGKVAYIQGIEHKNLQSLSSMGILPGVKIKVKQNFPSFLFEIGNSQFAVDAEIASAIYVRLEKD